MKDLRPITASNLEIKASLSDRESVRDRLMVLGATSKGTLHQIDVYFPTGTNRLKLRTITGQGSQLISYQRDNQSNPRLSTYHLVPTEHPDLLLAALRDALGIRCRVEKYRQLFLWHNVRIHLDQVINLGDFIELEAVLSSEEDVQQSRNRVATLLDFLGISPSNLLADSYGDLMVNL